jgi:8-oxo-dGTP pyrophosphatase MutT (NUDIX family)
MPEKLFVAAKAAILKDNMILLLGEERNGKVSFDFPGGRVDPGESPAEGLKRELLEEIGIETKEVSDLPIAIWQEERKDPFIFLLYQVELTSAEYQFEKTSDTAVVSAEYYSLDEIKTMQNFVRLEDRLPALEKILS